MTSASASFLRAMARPLLVMVVTMMQQPGLPRLELLHHRLERQEVARAGAVEPDPRAPAPEVERAPVVAEPERDPVAQLRVPEQHRQQGQEEEVARDGVEEVHVRAFFTRCGWGS